MGERTGLGETTSLGALEAAVMDAVWNLGEASVRAVHGRLESERGVAYTTVMTVMGRLADKGLLSRRKEGRAYLYTATRPREVVAGSLLRTLVGRLYHGSASRAIAHLIETEPDVDGAELQRLEELIRRKRSRARR